GGARPRRSSCRDGCARSPSGWRPRSAWSPPSTSRLPGSMLDIVQLPLGAYRTNCYLVAREGASDAAVIDPGDSPDTVLSVLGDRGWKTAGVLLTHGHDDHLGAVRGVAEAAGVDVW